MEAAADRPVQYSNAIGGPVVVKGHSGYLFVPAVVIPGVAVTALAYYRDNLPSFCVENADKVLALSALLSLILAGVALFLRSRRVELRGNHLHYHSWFTDRARRIEDITAVTFETELAGGDGQNVTEHYLTLWAGNETYLRFNTQRWPRPGLLGLLRALHERHPAIRLDHAVERYIEG